jgi:hypothetical protein
LAIVGGLGVAALSFRLLPPLSAAFRTRRLLALTLRDLRRLITSRLPRTGDDWEEHAYGRLAALPDEATPLQRAQLLAGQTVGSQIIRLRRLGSRLGRSNELDWALQPLALGDIALAIARLAQLDQVLDAIGMPAAIRARAGILAISEALIHHAAYFNTGARW